MDESHLHTHNSLTGTISNEDSPSFILQSSIDDQKEENSSNQQTTPLLISQIYEDLFYDHFHMNYYGECESQGLFLASIRCVPSKSREINGGGSTHSSKEIIDEENCRVVNCFIRTEINNYHVSELINIDHEKHLLEILFEKAQLSPIHYSEYIDYIKSNEKILQFDKWNDDQHSIKVAFIFQRSNQQSENEILSNSQMSNEMVHFLNLISERIELKDFHHYRGDLDTKSNLHGIYSYFTKFDNHQIMFNVSPMISSDENDHKYIQRKSLIANALVCIVFQEKGSQAYQPNLILGKVTQVYIVVQPIDYHGGQFYQIQIWRRSGIEPIRNPLGGLWKCSSSIRNDFLRLIIDSVNCILRKDFFQKRIVEQRQRLKNEALKKLCHFFHSHSKHRLSMSNNKSEEDIHMNTSSPSKSALRKHRRHSFLPKLIATFASNRAESPPRNDPKNRSSSSSRASFSTPTEQSDRSNESNTSFITYLNKPIENSQQRASRAARISARKSLPNVHHKGRRNSSPINDENTDGN